MNAMMPTVFMGHGSPMNVINDNAHSTMLKSAAKKWPTPKSILVVSAHWETPESKVLKVDRPKTIHDFGGFPPELYQMQYPAPGAPELAEKVHALAPEVDLTNNWGLDHGAWTILYHLYPDANIPVTQLSLSRALNYRQHFELARKLKSLRSEGVLILGSGNLIHNLRLIKWQTEAPALDWAAKFDQILHERILAGDRQFLLNPESVEPELAHLSLPSLEHYLPVLYAVGATDEGEKVEYLFEGIQNASISMRSFVVGA